MDNIIILVGGIHMFSMQFTFFNKNGEKLMDKKLTSLPLKEEFIIQKSIEWFDDPEPCMIHRSAVMNKIYTRIGEYIKEQKVNELLWNDLPESIRSAFDINGQVYKVIVKCC
jgi:hypothetical protein